MEFTLVVVIYRGAFYPALCDELGDVLVGPFEDWQINADLFSRIIHAANLRFVIPFRAGRGLATADSLNRTVIDFVFLEDLATETRES